MSGALKLELELESGVKELGVVQPPEVLLGRDPGKNGIIIDNPAVSRTHGVIFQQGRHWFYRDLGSTNGSWLDGRSFKGGLPRLLRPGSMLRLADSSLRVSASNVGFAESHGLEAGGRSLLVYSGGAYLDEYPIAEYGRALVVGGREGDLEIAGDVYELPSVIFERSGDKIRASRVVKDTAALHNGAAFSEFAELADGDCVTIGEYDIFLNDPGPVGFEGVPSSQILSGGDSWGLEDSKESDESIVVTRPTAARLTFGQFGIIPQAEGEDADFSGDADLTSRSGGHPAARLGPRPGSVGADGIGERIFLVAGFLLLVSILIFAIWLLLS